MRHARHDYTGERIATVDILHELRREFKTFHGQGRREWVVYYECVCPVCGELFESTVANLKNKVHRGYTLGCRPCTKRNIARAKLREVQRQG